ncbi:MAG: 2OG-Fe(II) oxygenase [Saprospiraceae bacterium]|nr:2OG-Fe(II) oxygenase [Saprospiraceae bacterium]MBK8513503.1 2OG-Fe(II) oxygenase [Saprospiraceae bacterium]MBK9932070.1 2OG-Fe(II) oxygenase [Saprospiraceae bacterium]MBL0110376.1 2OG-Fe(II) oxygenase [Saprospiraceae bacterium]MBP9135174.1 2OG-Fe(II) oxygenase [Saprospiraceae bacterium]
MIQIENIEKSKIETTPYEWCFIDDLFSNEDKRHLSSTYPMDHFKSVNGYDGEKSYVYECRNLIHMGAGMASFSDDLNTVWVKLAQDLLSDQYRLALSKLCQKDLSLVPMEVNIFHYSPGTWMGPHVDLKDKIVTHVIYFNQTWDDSQGGCLSILNSNDPGDLFRRISPITGHSVVLVRSNHSWHAVEKVKQNIDQSRRSMTVTFYHPGSVSTMWPPNDTSELHMVKSKKSEGGFFKRIKNKFYFDTPFKPLLNREPTGFT